MVQSQVWCLYRILPIILSPQRELDDYYSSHPPQVWHERGKFCWVFHNLAFTG